MRVSDVNASRQHASRQQAALEGAPVLRVA